MNKFFFALLVGMTITITTAQEVTYNSTNNLVTIADLRNKTYKKDTTANAFFIYEKGHSYVENGGDYNLLTDYEAKIKILNRKGYKWATVTFPLYRADGYKEFLRNIEAYTHNLENGEIKKIKISKDQIIKEVYDKNYTFIKFTFPNIKEGSVITYKYRIESPYMHRFNGWEFQGDIPKMTSEFNADIPGNYVYNIRLIGGLKLAEENSRLKKNCISISGLGAADCSSSTYIMKDIPAFKEENYMTARKNYLSRIEYVLKEFKAVDGSTKRYTETWKDADQRLKKEPTIGGQLKKINLVADLLPPKLSQKTNDLNKAKEIYTYVNSHYKWNGKYDIYKASPDTKLKKVIENKTGNVAGINLLLHNILKQQGYEVYPVLVATRNQGFPTTIHPVIYDFNYSIVQLRLDDKTYLLDATESQLAFGEIPFRCLNKYGRLLDFKKGSSWINLKSSQRSSYFFKEELTLTDLDSIHGIGSYFFSGYYGLDKRKELDQKDKTTYYKEIKDALKNISISTIQIENENNPDKAFEERLSFKKYVEPLDDLFIIKPFTRPFFTENPFKLPYRTYPVDFGHKNTFSYLITIKIPESYEYVDLIEPKKYILPEKSGILTIKVTQEDQILKIFYRINLNSSYYKATYYQGLKEFFSRIIELENDTFIAIKKTT